MKKLSIVIPFHNSEKTLRDAVSSFISYSGADIEIFLVNDNSEDGSLKLALDMAADDERICVIEAKGRGVSAARNAALEKIDSELTMFVDSDDSQETDRLDELIAAMDDETVMEVFGYRRYHTGCVPSKNFVQDLGLEDKRWDSTEAYLEDFFYPRNRTTIWAKLFRSSVIKENNIRFDTSLRGYEDLVFVNDYLQKAKGKVRQNSIIAYNYFTEDSRYDYERFLNRSMDIFPAFKLIFDNISDSCRTGAELYYTELMAMTMRRLLLVDGYKKEDSIPIRNELKKYKEKYIHSEKTSLFHKVFVWSSIYLPGLIKLGSRCLEGIRWKGK